MVPIINNREQCSIFQHSTVEMLLCERCHGCCVCCLCDQDTVCRTRLPETFLGEIFWVACLSTKLPKSGRSGSCSNSHQLSSILRSTQNRAQKWRTSSLANRRGWANVHSYTTTSNKRTRLALETLAVDGCSSTILHVLYKHFARYAQVWRTKLNTSEAVFYQEQRLPLQAQPRDIHTTKYPW